MHVGPLFCVWLWVGELACGLFLRGRIGARLLDGGDLDVESVRVACKPPIAPPLAITAKWLASKRTAARVGHQVQGRAPTEGEGEGQLETWEGE